MHQKTPILPKHIFWDVEIDKLDFDKKKNFIIVRVFERGDFKEITQIRRYYSDETIISCIKNAKFIDEETFNFLSLYYDIPKENFLCYKNKQLRGIHSTY
jgi:hypothetical protein